MSRWEGVTAEGAPLRVTGLDLTDKQLTGTISPELGGLTNLTAVVSYLQPTDRSHPTGVGQLD